jgi:sugar phosphate isomerase/epimerase
MLLSLSTMWAQQERFADIRDFARTARDLGYAAIEVNYTVVPEAFAALTNGDILPLSSVHSPMPRVRHSDGRWSDALNLASVDEDERRAAVEFAGRTIDHAADTGVRYVVLHLGGVGSEMLAPERKLRRLFDSGTREGPEVAALREELRRERAGRSAPSFETARRTLGELADHASRRGVRLALENRYHLHEIPSIEECEALLAEYPADLVGYWHDVGHAEVLGRLGLIDRRRWLDTLGPRTLGCHLHDVDGLGDHRAPGRGDVDWSYIASGLPKGAVRVFEIDQRQPDEALAAAIPFLQERGVV